MVSSRANEAKEISMSRIDKFREGISFYDARAW